MSVRIALLSDVHGNPLALDAVLADVAAAGGADAYWILGDLAALGYDPPGAFERLAALPGVRFVYGNTERYLLTGERPPPSLADVQRDPALLGRFVEVAENFAWTLGTLARTDWLDWLAMLPLEHRVTLPDGTRLLGVHASPGHDGSAPGTGIHPGRSEAELRALLENSAADLVCVGHTHWPLDRWVGGVRVINLGSVSNPRGSGPARELRAA
jgi:predicted phosphodiesterase